MSSAAARVMAAANHANLLELVDTILKESGVEGQLRWLPIDQTLDPNHQYALGADTEQGSQLVLGQLTAPLQAPEQWTWLETLVSIRLGQLAETDRLYEAVSQLADSERLQRALYAIAEQAGSEADMPSVMQALHGIVGGLMYAENFYIVLYDAITDTLRFPYYADVVDTELPPANESIPLEQVKYSLTWSLLQEARPLIGSPAELKQQLGENFQPKGAHCAHLIAVPLQQDGHVIGGIVTQSYRAGMDYSEGDLKLLSYVAQHVVTALARREAHIELSRRVADRTRALRETNRILREQVLQRQRGERLQAALFRITELASSSDEQESFYAALHTIIGGLLYARNFYIALAQEGNDMLTFPYSMDEIEGDRPPRAHGRGATEYVLRTGQPLLADPAEFERLEASGELIHGGTRSLRWLGVPLMWNGKAIGVITLQSYSPEYTYEPRDQELLTFVGHHVAAALQRKQAGEALKVAYASLEHRVNERTFALARANRDLRDQIGERERVERRLKYETLHDSLTGLPNRTMLLQRLEQAMHRFGLNPSDQFAVLFIDLDRFKVINDSVGHLVGDDLLFQVGGRIRACLKSRDLVARLGGDEFAVLLESIRDSDKAMHVADRIIQALHTPFRLGAKEIFTSASVGIALASAHYQQPEELLRDADAAMYDAKDGGRHRAALFDDRLRSNALTLLDMESDLRNGVRRNEFVPFYQPIVELSNGRVVGYEALLRWNHPQRGWLAPGEFLMIAEDCGCAEVIDWQIFEQACAQAPRLAQGDGFISINVSGQHFRSADLDTRLLALFARHDVSPQNMRIEVTERVLLENSEQVQQILQNLRNQGVGIALDDFGTGYSSLSYLHRYPFETLKIDQSFVRELPLDGEETQGLALVRTIQVMADSLRLKVIAEGIEEETQRRALLQLGCRFGQGYLFSRAQPAEIWLQADHPLRLA